MAETHRRVQELRREAGIPPEPESSDLREARLNAIQFESLGSDRRHRISTSERRSDWKNQVHWQELEGSRLSNISGTKENRESQNNKAKLSLWNNAWVDLEHDGAVEEDLGDINRGQSHRAKLIGDLSLQAQHEEHPAGHYAQQATHNAPPRGGNRGGRGGGAVGGQSRASRGGYRGGRGGGSFGSQSRPLHSSRVPVGLPSVGSRGSDAGHRKSRSDPQSAKKESALGPKSYKEAIKPKIERLPAPQAAPAQNVAKPARIQNWGGRLATPETFTAAIRRDPNSPADSSSQESAPLVKPSAPAKPSVPVVQPSAPAKPSTPVKISTPVKLPSAPAKQPSVPVTQPSTPVKQPSAPVKLSAPVPPTVVSSEAPVIAETANAVEVVANLARPSSPSPDEGPALNEARSIVRKPSLLIDFVTPQHTKSDEKAPSYSGDLIGLEMLSGSGGLAEEKKQPSTAISVNPNLTGFQPAPILRSVPSLPRAMLPISIDTLGEHRERIVSRISMEENIHFGRKRTDSNIIIGAHLMPGRFRGARRASDSVSPPSTISSVGAVASSSVSPTNAEWGSGSSKADSASSAQTGQIITEPHTFAAETAFGNPAPSPMNFPQSGGIMDSPIYEPAFSGSTASTTAAPLAANAERPREAFARLSSENLRQFEESEEQDSDEEDPLTRITTNVQMPSGPSRLSSLMGLSNPYNQPLQRGARPPPRQGNNRWNGGFRRNM